MCLAGRIGKAEYGVRLDTRLLLAVGSGGTGPLHAVWCDSMHPQMLVVSASVKRPDSHSFFDVAFFLSGLCSDNCSFRRRLHNKYMLELERKKSDKRRRKRMKKTLGRCENCRKNQCL
jgi:hypothetical protein